MTEEEAKRTAWELVNEFVAGCSGDGHGLDNVQTSNAVLLSDWLASALLEASKPKWVPIENADKSKEIVALAPEYDGPIALKWFKYNGTEAWRDWDGDANNPTHFLPLPPGELKQPLNDSRHEQGDHPEGEYIRGRVI